MLAEGSAQGLQLSGQMRQRVSNREGECALRRNAQNNRANSGSLTSANSLTSSLALMYRGLMRRMRGFVGNELVSTYVPIPAADS